MTAAHSSGWISLASVEDAAAMSTATAFDAPRAANAAAVFIQQRADSCEELGRRGGVRRPVRGIVGYMYSILGVERGG